ncbi:MAG: hypothetical protein R8M38_10485 [Mariprofundaceae bacterium]
MSAKNIAIVGLGQVGTELMEKLLERKDLGLEINCASELNDTPGKKKAIARGVPLKTIEEIVAAGEAVDIIFDLTGSTDVRHHLRELLFSSGNKYTVIAPENVAHIVWALLTHNRVPDSGRNSGY